MRIIQLIDSLKVGGAERMAVNIASYLSLRNIDNLLISSRQGGGLEKQLDPRARLEILNKRSFLDVRAFKKLYKLVNDFKPHVIHAHSTSIFWAIGLKIILGRNLNVIFHDHYGKAEALRLFDRRPLRWISSQIDGVITVNDLLQSWALSVMKVEKNKVIQLNNFPYLPINEMDIRSSDKIGILHLANFRPQKDHFTLLEALKLLERDCKYDWSISMVGLSESQDYKSLIEKKIHELGLRHRIKYMSQSDDVVPFLLSSSVGVLSSESEGLSVSLLEYGLAGLHVVATDVGQTKVVIPSEDLGLIIPPKDPKALANALCMAIENSLLGRNFKLKEHINLNFGPGQFYKRYFEFLDSLYASK